MTERFKGRKGERWKGGEGEGEIEAKRGSERERHTHTHTLKVVFCSRPDQYFVK